MAAKRSITSDDILPLEVYAADRKARRKALVDVKRHRRIEVGPVCTFYFENYETMWSQVQEMLYIEKGGDEQLKDELEAYNPLIPQGSELVATVMFEIDEPVRRATFLSKLGGVEETAFFQFDGETVMSTPEEDVDRTTADGKASAVQFMHFHFTADQVAKFRTENQQVILGFKHEAYSHMVVLPEGVRAALAQDFD
ncbi:DUF3501 family protein [Denitrobaculum tricleocarpae]|uniref:DUF3501 family protein n=2 Tax=Denitrobaculum tricleocarpae TaxID=2591009 RepID=A0A545TS01_9PROT|nr:DUF3501 family protein [Denitrobaculum tricleocarpae]